MNIVSLSPSSLNLFLDCQHCFWLEKKKGIKRPLLYPYELNSTVDALLKEEFDAYRKRDEVHPLLLQKKIHASLFSNQKILDSWRNTKEGIRFFDKRLQAELVGIIDDVLEFSNGALSPFDYKSTGKKVSRVYDRFQLQMDIYAFLLEKNGYKINHKGYLAFYIIDTNKGFLDRLPFRKEIYEIEVNPADVYGIFQDAVTVINKNQPPIHSQDCAFGSYISSARVFLSDNHVI